MDQNGASSGASANDLDVLNGLLGSLSEGAARAAADALDAMLAKSGLSRSGADPFAGRIDVERLLTAIAEILSRQSGDVSPARGGGSVNQIAAVLARAVQRGARFT